MSEASDNLLVTSWGQSPPWQRRAHITMAQNLHSIPPLFGGYPTQTDFIPSIIITVLHVLLLPLFIYRCCHKSSRTVVLNGMIAFAIERSVSRKDWAWSSLNNDVSLVDQLRLAFEPLSLLFRALKRLWMTLKGRWSTCKQRSSWQCCP